MWPIAMLVIEIYESVASSLEHHMSAELNEDLRIQNEQVKGGIDPCLMFMDVWEMQTISSLRTNAMTTAFLGVMTTLFHPLEFEVGTSVTAI